MKSTLASVALAAGLASAMPAADTPAGYYGGEAPASTTTYACNPAHSYPNGATCISTAGSLTLVTPAPSTTGYACNPAHAYPEGVTCVSSNGSLTLVTPKPSATGYACNPAHAYPEGVTCVSSNGSLTLVTPAPQPTGTKEQRCYEAYNKCRVAPDANRAYCASQYAECLGYNPFANNGTNTVTPKYEPDTYVTKVVTELTTYCPEPTTLTYNKKTYTVTSATTLTIKDCPCTVSYPVTKPETHPTPAGTTKAVGIPPSVRPSGTPNVPSQPVNVPSSTRTTVPYTGAADKLNVGGALLAGALGFLAL